MPDFIPGLELCGRFYREAIRPILDADFPGLVHSAAMIHTGSEVLGFDTPQSTDHNWGPRVDLFLTERDQPYFAESITETLRHKLPYQFCGYSTNFAPVSGEPRSVLPQDVQTGPINHRVFVYTVRSFFKDYLAFDISNEISPADWLTFPDQKLRTLTSGSVYHDGLGDLTVLQAKLSYYPRDVWLYLLASVWGRIGQEEAFVGRCGAVGDDLGSRVIAARLVRDLMRLCFLSERQYAPYPKWFGTGFSRLNCAEELTPIFQRVLSAENWRERESHLSEAYSIVAEMHNSLGITASLPTKVSSFHERPYLVIHGDEFSGAIKAEIKDPEVQRIAAKTTIGSIDQFSDSTDLIAYAGLRQHLVSLYADES